MAITKRTALARRLAVEVAHYRAEHGLSQRQLAERLGVHQSDIARGSFALGGCEVVLATA